MKPTKIWSQRRTFVCLVFSLFAAGSLAHAYDTRWGLLASSGWDQQPIKGVYFFPGEGACQASDNEVSPQQRPVQHPNIPNDVTWPCHEISGWLFNSKFYTYTPADPRDLHWNDTRQRLHEGQKSSATLS